MFWYRGFSPWNCLFLYWTMIFLAKLSVYMNLTLFCPWTYVFLYCTQWCFPQNFMFLYTVLSIILCKLSKIIWSVHEIMCFYTILCDISHRTLCFCLWDSLVLLVNYLFMNTEIYDSVYETLYSYEMAVFIYALYSFNELSVLHMEIYVFVNQIWWGTIWFYMRLSSFHFRLSVLII